VNGELAVSKPNVLVEELPITAVVAVETTELNLKVSSAFIIIKCK
jgi:hypothetical protein